MRDTELRTVQVERDLGVHIDCDLKFRQHAATVVAKATQVLAVIRRSFARIDQQTLPVLYKSLVRPHLEFGNLVWGHFNRADEKLVERVQHRATCMVPDLCHVAYKEQLEALQLASLYYRCKHRDMVHTYQMFHGGVDRSIQLCTACHRIHH